MDTKKDPLPGKSINKEPASPSTGQHQPDIQDEKYKRKHGNMPRKKENINPEGFSKDNPEEYNDGVPVEEKSPRISNGL